LLAEQGVLVTSYQRTHDVAANGFVLFDLKISIIQP